MGESPKITFDPGKGRLYFNGACNEVRDVCGAVCCSFYGVDLSEEERGSGKYSYHRTCNVSGKACVAPNDICVNRRYVLDKNEDGSCVYLTPSKKCGIYETRPKACRDFSCELGWNISGAVRSESYEKISSDFLKATFHKEMKLTFNPEMKVKTMFYSPEKKNISFVVMHPAKCGYMSLEHAFASPGITDEVLLYIYRCFNGQRTLGDVERDAVSMFPAVTGEVLNDVVAAFLRLRLLLPVHCKKMREEA